MSALPCRGRGRPNAAAEAQYQEDLRRFCEQILEIKSRLDFEVGARGWCYLIEGERIIDKGEFDACERLIVSCRKDGNLPLDICAEDSKRAVDGVEELDDTTVEEEAYRIASYAGRAHLHYKPISFWDELDVYVEIAVEKSDLKSLFTRVAAEFHVPIQNVGGWSDLNVRAGMMRRFRKWEKRGKQCVLLYCGDHDPGGLNISKFLYSNFAELEKAAGWSPFFLNIDRFGLNYDFIEAQGLTWIENLETSSGRSLADSRHPDHQKPYVQDYLARYGLRKVEANALVARPEAGRELCRQAILQYVPAAAVAAYEERLALKQEELRLEVIRLLGGAA
jgi:hypothetical protein